MKKLIISVTQEDIDAGHRCNCGHCPIARAVRRAFDLTQIPYDKDVMSVVRRAIYPMGVVNVRPKYNLSPVATSFIDAFDNKWPVKPIIFEIELAKY